MTTAELLGYELSDEIKKQLEPEHRTINVDDWSVYTNQSKTEERIGGHLFLMTYHLTDPVMTNNEEHCVHQSCQTIMHCVGNLSNITMDPFFALSKESLAQKLFSDNCSHETLCNHCLLILVTATRNLEIVIDKLYDAYCYSDTFIYANASCWYLFHIILRYPFVIKYMLKHTSNIHKLSEILIFYLSKIKIHLLEHMHSNSFCNPQKGYNITNELLIAVNIFEYNLSCILLVYCAFIPYFNKQHLLKLIELKLPTILVHFISNSDYIKLPHIQSGIAEFYKKHHSKSMFSNATKIASVKRFGRTIHLMSRKASRQHLWKSMESTNIILAKLLDVYSLLFQKIKKFKEDKTFSVSYDLLNQITLPQIADYKYHSFEEVFFSPEAVINTEWSDQCKLRWFVHCGIMTKSKLLIMEKQRSKAVNQCANYQCRFQHNQRKKYKWCGGCQFVLYCSRKCQKIDWTSGHHRDICKTTSLIPTVTIKYLKPSFLND